MAALIKERNGNRVFERICRWNIIDYTIISKNNRFVKYADSFENTEKYPLTYFKLRQSYFLEVNSDNTKVRLYREVTNED